MKIEYCLSDDLRVITHGINGEIWIWAYPIDTLNVALEVAENIINGATTIDYEQVESVHIVSDTTGKEILTCAPDDLDYEDWNFNEDEGFDPYMGCYTDDC